MIYGNSKESVMHRQAEKWAFIRCSEGKQTVEKYSHLHCAYRLGSRLKEKKDEIRLISNDEIIST